MDAAKDEIKIFGVERTCTNFLKYGYERIG